MVKRKKEQGFPLVGEDRNWLGGDVKELYRMIVICYYMYPNRGLGYTDVYICPNSVSI